MKELYLKSPKLKVVKVLKQTKAQGFKELKIGDTFQLRIEVRYLGRNRGTYACYFDIAINGNDFIETSHSFNTITKYLDCFELEEV